MCNKKSISIGFLLVYEFIQNLSNCQIVFFEGMTHVFRWLLYILNYAEDLKCLLEVTRVTFALIC